MTDFQVFQIYRSVKTHYRSKNFDIRKFGYYQRKDSSKIFDDRPDHKLFEKLGQQYQTEYRLSTMLGANLFINPDMWVGDFLDDEVVREHYFRLRRFNDSVSFELRKQTQALKHKYGNLSTTLETDGQQVPPIISEVLSGRNGNFETIAPETLVVYNAALGILSHINKKMIEDHVIWNSLYLRFRKYSAFVLLRKDQATRAREIIQEVFI